MGISRSRQASIGVLFAILGLLLLHVVHRGEPLRSPRAIVAHGWRTAQDIGRELNAVDKLQRYKQDPNCSISSLDLHHPFGPMCTSRKSLLEAMSGGGRQGWDLPYKCRGCDMQWFDMDDICKILTRFDNIYLIGDSLLRHVAQAINVLIRGDLISGGRATWRTDLMNDPGCFCHRVFDEVGCVFWSSVNTEMVLAGDPRSIKCRSPAKLGLVEWIPALNFPLKPEVVDVLANKFRNLTPDGRSAFVIDHGNWNSFEIDTTMAWVEQVDEIMRQWMPDFYGPDVPFIMFPRLYMTASSEGENKPQIFMPVQNNINLQRHIRAIRPYVKKLGYEHLAIFNLTVQATSPDGTHASFENNLVKAMMILNWLNMLQPPIDTNAHPEQKDLTTSYNPAIKGEYAQLAADSEAVSAAEDQATNVSLTQN